MANPFLLRRQRLVEMLTDHAAVLVFSGEEIPLGVDMTYPFSVDRNFYYLTGLDMPGCALYLSRDCDILFLPPLIPSGRPMRVRSLPGSRCPRFPVFLMSEKW